jgi:hypothetical protein
MNVVEAISDPRLLQPWFSGPSWDSWRAVLKGAFAMPMSESELATFRQLAQRDPPKKRVRELWIVAGRRAGKDSIASAIACWAAAGTDYKPLLRPGELASVMCVAVDRNQAKIVNRYARAYFRENPMLAGLVTGETADTIELATGAELAIVTNSFRATRGRSIACAVLDECAFYRDESAANPDFEVYQALLPGLVTLSDSMLVGISSPYRRGGLLYRKWKDHFGKDSDDVLVIHAASRQLNPTIDPKVISDALEQDAPAARAEWLGEWRDDVQNYVSREIVEAAVTPGVLARPPLPRERYVAFCDPSGGSSDSMTLGIAHKEGDRYFLDVLLERKAPFAPEDAVREFAATLRGYHVNRVTGDRYAAEWSATAFQRHGIQYEPSELSKSEVYLSFLPLLNSAQVELLDQPRLINQLANLERRVVRGGRESVDHPPGPNQHDDLANACAGALVLASSKSAGAVIVSDEALANLRRAWGRRDEWADLRRRSNRTAVVDF